MQPNSSTFAICQSEKGIVSIVQQVLTVLINGGVFFYVYTIPDCRYS
jgi:fructose-1,6-bisphosphatase